MFNAIPVSIFIKYSSLLIFTILHSLFVYTNDNRMLTNLFTAELAQRFSTEGMLAYVELIQKKEKELGVDVLKHQRWSVLFRVPWPWLTRWFRSGANYIDSILSSELFRKYRWLEG
jgi:hypothetical protein